MESASLALPPPKVPETRRRRVESGKGEHRKRQLEDRLAAGPFWQDHDLVFPSSTGRPVSDSNLRNRDFSRVLKEAGLPRFRPHDLRHTMATAALLAGVHPKVVQERLGHSRISVTLDTYSLVLPSLQRDAAEQIDEALFGGKNRPQRASQEADRRPKR